MPDNILEQARKKRQTRTAIAWIGGGCLFAFLALLQLILLVSWAHKRVELKKGTIEKRAEERASLRAKTEHPVLPAWVPVYPGGEPKGGAGAREGEVALRTLDKPDRVLDFYAERLRTNGFAVRPRTEQAMVYTLEGRRPDGSEVTVQSGTGMHPAGTWIVVTYKATVAATDPAAGIPAAPAPSPESPPGSSGRGSTASR
jgi:hypothetical protein